MFWLRWWLWFFGRWGESLLSNISSSTANRRHCIPVCKCEEVSNIHQKTGKIGTDNRGRLCDLSLCLQRICSWVPFGPSVLWIILPLLLFGHSGGNSKSKLTGNIPSLLLKKYDKYQRNFEYLTYDITKCKTTHRWLVGLNWIILGSVSTSRFDDLSAIKHLCLGPLHHINNPWFSFNIQAWWHKRCQKIFSK